MIKRSLVFILLILCTCLPAQKLVRDINPGKPDSYIKFLSEFSNGFLFSAYDDTCGNELWFSDGTEAGTYRMMDIFPGINSGNFNLPYNDTGLSFLFNTNYNAKIFRSDGSQQGTYLIFEPNSNAPRVEYHMFIKYKNKYYFSAYDNADNDILITDGTDTGTKAWMNIVKGTFSPCNFVTLNGHLYITAFRTDMTLDFYESDGTVDGTKFLSNLGIVSGNLVACGNSIYYFSNSQTGFSKLKKIEPGINKISTVYADSLNRIQLPVLNYEDKIYFNTFNFDQVKRQVWYIDDQTNVYKPLTLSDTALLNPMVKDVIDLKAYAMFILYTDNYGDELWKIENNGTRAKFIMDVSPGPSGSAGDVPLYHLSGEDLYFSAFSSQFGESLWKFGTVSENLSLVYASPEPFRISSFFHFDDHFYFSGFLDSTYGIELYQLDPVSSGIRQTVKTDLKTYPNPVASGSYMMIDHPETSSIFRLYDLNGKVIQLKEENGRIYIPEYLSQGLYTLTVQSADHYQTIKISIL